MLFESDWRGVGNLYFLNEETAVGVGKKPQDPGKSLPGFTFDESGSEFLDTRSVILKAAAEGDWSEFFSRYLRPIWSEVVKVCRQRNVRLVDAEDMFQEIVLRMLREGSFHPRLHRELTQAGLDANVRGNLAARYMIHRQLPRPSARFRTYLKRVIHNVILESLRKRRGRERPETPLDVSLLEPMVEESVEESLDREWSLDCQLRAALLLKLDSERARTRGQRRHFDIMERTIVAKQSPQEIADDLALDASTIRELLVHAKAKYLKLLKDVCGKDDFEQLRDAVSTIPDALRIAFFEASTVSTDQAEPE